MTSEKTKILSAVGGACLALVVGLMGSPVLAEDAPPSNVASPDVYKILAETEQWRVVRATWQPGQEDTFHMHEADRVSVFETDCELEFTMPDGKTRIGKPKGGKVNARTGKPVAAHKAKNVGDKVCSIVIVELKK